MDFIDWNPLIRSVVFGGIFLVCLVPVLWQLYETIGSTEGGRWLWFTVSAVALVLTTPAIVVGAANLEESKETLLNVVSWMAIAGALLTVCAVAAYAAMARDQPLPEPAPTPIDVHNGLQFPSPEPAPAPTLVAPKAPRPAATNAFLFVKDGPDKGKQHPLTDVVVIGRDSGCSVTLDDRRVSSQHAQVKETGDQYVFTDLQSTNGSFLVVGGRDEPIRTSQVLVDGDEIRLGHTVLEFVDIRRGRRR
ncbi:MAG: FHA domain-containing protein [Dehalococcoidia bacterium]|nr:FHA domain-containing protein [Dehalococcoidia bacterium]